MCSLHRQLARFPRQLLLCQIQFRSTDLFLISMIEKGPVKFNSRYFRFPHSESPSWKIPLPPELTRVCHEIRKQFGRFSMSKWGAVVWFGAEFTTFDFLHYPVCFPKRKTIAWEQLTMLTCLKFYRCWNRRRNLLSVLSVLLSEYLVELLHLSKCWLVCWFTIFYRCTLFKVTWPFA